MSRKFEYDAGVDIAGTQYRVVRPLGAGGMGAVYEVEDLSVGRRFVMKTLHPELRDRADFVRRMQKEARILARLNHPNIVQVFTAGVTADALKVPYYIMERLEGQNLRMLIDAKGALPLHACYTIGIELLDALDRAHELGVIHRDVKPENVFIHRNGDGTATTKLLDFGIMSLLEGEVDETGNRFIGTLRYAAPEQAHGGKVTPLSDLYAVGLVLYEMVAGRGAFEDAEGLSELLDAHANRDPEPLSSLAACPPELEAVVMGALAKSPDDRPRDAFTFAAVLRKLKKGSKGDVASRASGRDTTTAEGVVVALMTPTPPPGAATVPMVMPGARRSPSSGVESGPLSGSLAGPAAGASEAAGLALSGADRVDVARASAPLENVDVAAGALASPVAASPRRPPASAVPHVEGARVSAATGAGTAHAAGVAAAIDERLVMRRRAAVALVMGTFVLSGATIAGIAAWRWAKARVSPQEVVARDLSALPSAPVPVAPAAPAPAASAPAAPSPSASAPPRPPQAPARATPTVRVGPRVRPPAEAPPLAPSQAPSRRKRPGSGI